MLINVDLFVDHRYRRSSWILQRRAPCLFSLVRFTTWHQRGRGPQTLVPLASYLQYYRPLRVMGPPVLAIGCQPSVTSEEYRCTLSSSISNVAKIYSIFLITPGTCLARPLSSQIQERTRTSNQGMDIKYYQESLHPNFPRCRLPLLKH